MNGPWDLVYFKRPLTINTVYGKIHFRERAKIVKEWREAYRQIAEDQKLPKGLSYVGIEVLPVLGTRALQDAGNCIPAAKAAIDGLLDGGKHAKDAPGYGMFPDDTPEYLAWVKLHASVYEKGVNALWLRVHDLS